MRINQSATLVQSPRFGHLTVLNPTLNQRVVAELDWLTSGKQTGLTTDVLQAIQVLRQDYPRDDNISWRGFVAQNETKGVYPHIGPQSRAGLFPLKDGWGLIATNSGNVTYGSDARYPEADLNHLMRMLAEKNNRGRATEDLVSDFLTNEKALHEKRANSPIVQLEVNTLA